MSVVKVFTGARRFPIIVGKFTNGRPIPLGPYSLTQIITGVGIIAGFLMLGTVTNAGPVTLAVLFVIGTVLGAAGVYVTGRITFDGIPMTHRLLRELDLQLSAGPISTAEELRPLGEEDLFVVGGDEIVFENTAIADSRNYVKSGGHR
ncbi:hypothetical protein [Nocardia altamirensis]|uniref:hypothetical protein n=1 Tax=Nocardia altamirensis TaxID=472158 RepID=UPI00083FE45E|nr:hypothetical protein [Nocardia altamirensis]